MKQSKIPINNKLLLLLCFYLPYSVYGTQDNELLVYKDVISEIYLRSWGSKGFGQFMGKELITVIKTKSDAGNVVVLKWNEAHDNFETEIYVSKEVDDILSSWTLLNLHKKKT